MFSNQENRWLQMQKSLIMNHLNFESWFLNLYYIYINLKISKENVEFLKFVPLIFIYKNISTFCAQYQRE